MQDQGGFNLSDLERNLQQELEAQLSGQNFEELLAAEGREFTSGEVVRGRVIDIGPDWVTVDIGYKSEGRVPRTEFGGVEDLAPGQEYDFYIEAPENEAGMPVLSKTKADRIKNWEVVQRVFQEDGVIEGVITRRVKGGVKVDIGVDAFMPASQISFRPVSDLDRYIGQRMEVKIIKLTPKRRNVVVSRRRLLEERRETERRRLVETVQPGQVLEGEVKNITDFGAFVDVGGIDGLLHVTDMSWGRVRHASQVVQVGQKVKVMVLSFDPQTERISLGMKQLVPNPWIHALEKYPVASVHRGRVVSITEYGAFVELEPGIEGMVHISEFSWTRRVRHPSEVVQVGDEVDVMILDINPETEKISLGIKQTQPNPWNTMHERYPIGSVVQGVVRNLTEFGAFIQLEEGIDALLHVSDMSWTKKINHPSEMLEKGDVVKVKVLSIDPQQERISVGLKQLEEDPWNRVVAKYPIGSHVEVEIAKMVSFGAFGKLDEGIEGLIHFSEFPDGGKGDYNVSVGQKVWTKVISINPTERKIGLSIREYQRDMDKSLLEQHGNVDVDEELRRAGVPESVLEAGKGLADALPEMLAAVSESLRQPATETPKPAQPAPQTENVVPGSEAGAVVTDAASDSEEGTA
jgi:small subunit ribosomal protein S1